jgi:hypothetical protein
MLLCGATTLRVMVFIKMTLSINDIQRNNTLHYAKCRYAECLILFIVLLSIIMLNVIMLSVVVLNVIIMSVMAPVMLTIVMLSVVGGVHSTLFPVSPARRKCLVWDCEQIPELLMDMNID